MNSFSLIKNLNEIFSHPTSLVLLAGIVVVITLLLTFRKIKLTTRIMAQIGISLALATILSFLKFFQLPYGGSATLGSMVPILLMALLYGPEVGYLTGFLYGMITLIIDPYILHPVQVLFDYPLAFMSLGLAGYFRNLTFTFKSKQLTRLPIILGVFTGILGRFVCSFISGIVFFASYAPKGMSPILYSIVYNGSYLGVDAVICIVVISLLPVKQLKAAANRATA